MSEETARPVPKVAAAGMSGAAVTLLVGIAQQLGVAVPPEVAAAAVTVASFLAGYLRPAR